MGLPKGLVTNRTARMPGDYQPQTETPKRSKYGNTKLVVDGYTFDSKAEATRYGELLQLERAGRITHLEVHPKFALLPALKWNGKTLRARHYVADFSYREVERPGRDIVEDVKGMRTKDYLLKRHMLLAWYPGIEFRELTAK